MSLWLSSDELIDYTGFRQREKQYTALAQLGTAFKIRPADGFPLVLREHVVPKQGKAVRRERVRAMNMALVTRNPQDAMVHRERGGPGSPFRIALT